MNFSGTHDVRLSQDTVWRSLRNAEVLAASIPGCESFERIESAAEAYRSIVNTKVGPMKAKFTGQMEIVDADPPNSYKLVGSGSAGNSGAAKGEVIISLSPIESNVTRLSFDASVTLTGRMAQIGGRMINSTAEAFANEFFQNLTRNAETTDDGPLQRAEAFEVSGGKWKWVIVAVVIAAVIGAVIVLL
jgi:carbon monoxide dehydrogenase subunit G